MHTFLVPDLQKVYFAPQSRLQWGGFNVMSYFAFVNNPPVPVYNRGQSVPSKVPPVFHPLHCIQTGMRLLRGVFNKYAEKCIISFNGDHTFMKIGQNVNSFFTSLYNTKHITTVIIDYVQLTETALRHIDV